MPDEPKRDASPSREDRWDVELDPVQRTAALKLQRGLLMPQQLDVPFAVLKGVMAAILSAEAAREARAAGPIDQAAPRPRIVGRE